MNALIRVYKDAFSSYKDRALRMLGITWFAGLISFLATILLSGIMLLALAVDFAVSSALAVIYLREYNKEQTTVEDVFAPFSDREKLRRVVLGMAWMNLWIFIWALIPVVGIVFAIIKGYKYRFTPYVLMNEPEIPIMEAIKESERRTEGLRLKMFIAELAAYSALTVVCIILGLLSMIPYVGVVFLILLILCMIAGVAAMPVVTNALNCLFFAKRDEYLEDKLSSDGEPVVELEPTAESEPATESEPTAESEPATESESVESEPTAEPEVKPFVKKRTTARKSTTAAKKSAATAKKSTAAKKTDGE